jgi:hypothetical protein
VGKEDSRLRNFWKRRPAAPLWAVLSLALLVWLLPTAARGDDPETWMVSGTMHESGTEGVATGDLAGPYVIRFLSLSDDGTTTTGHSRRTISTAEGELVLDELGQVDDATGVVAVTSTVIRGTGIFKHATGGLHLGGQINADGSVSLTDTGTSYLED